ncbi:MAG: hypothetical protein ACXVBB_19060 [Isosphaeraceae bacterium]
MSKKFKHPKILLNAAPGDHFGPGAVIVLPDYGDGECSDQAQRKMALDLIQMNRVWGQMQADANLSEQFKKMLGDLDNVYQLLRTQEGCPAFGLFARGFAPPPVTAAPRKIALRETNSVPPGTTLGWGSPSEVHASLLSLRARQDALKRSLAAKGIDAPGAGEDRETITIHGVKYSYDDLDPVKAAIKKSMANGEFLTQDQVRKAIEDKTAELGLDSETFTEVMKSVNNVRSEKLLSYQDTHPAPPGQQWTIDMDGKMQLIPTVSLGTMAPYDNSGAGSSSVNKAPEGVGYTPDQGSPPPAGVWNSAPPDSEGAPPAPIGVGSGPSNPQPVTPPSGSCVPGQKVTIKGVTFICGLPYGVPPAKQKKK